MFDSEPSSLESEDDNIFFHIQDPPVVHTPSVDIDVGTLPHVHTEAKPPHRFGELTRVFTRRTSTAYVSTSSAILIFETHIDENTSKLPSVNYYSF